MDETAETETLESDDRFPSGPWEGFWLQPEVPPGKHPMELKLEFQHGRMSGEGRDAVGQFNLTGRYDTSDGRCHFTKSYPNRHTVPYSGYNEGRGIWGTWELPDYALRGGFHIWPLGSGSGDGIRLVEEADVPLELIAEPIGAAPQTRTV